MVIVLLKPKCVLPIDLSREKLDMNVFLWISVIILAPAVAYTTQLSSATLSFGRALSETGSGTGYQDAITPPWSANFGIVVYGLALAMLALSWYEFGIGRAVLSLVAVFLLTLLSRRFLPREDSLHFKKLIVQSMSRRYANFVRDGDRIRAAAMKELLEKAGVPSEVLSG
jgi:hypothetical protein